MFVRYMRFVARTVLIKDNNVEDGLKVLNRIMSDEGFIDIYRRNLYYEKPFQMRRRVNYERAKAIYNEDMTRKMKLIMRTNRVNPWIGSL